MTTWAEECMVMYFDLTKEQKHLYDVSMVTLHTTPEFQELRKSLLETDNGYYQKFETDINMSLVHSFDD